MTKHSDEPKIEGITLSEKRIKELFELNRWQKIYYPIRRFVNKFNPKDRSRDVKYFVQRGKRGYDDTTWWSLDHYLKDVIPPALRRLANDGIGFHPLEDADFDKMQNSDEDWQAEANRWKAALLKAADDIEAFYKHDELDFPKTKKAQTKFIKERQEAMERTKAGMHFVAEYFLGLWD